MRRDYVLHSPGRAVVYTGGQLLSLNYNAVIKIADIQKFAAEQEQLDIRGEFSITIEFVTKDRIK
jgi:hypothetical protein